MRLAFISDTHSNAVAFERVIQDLKEQSPDAILFLGDAVMKGPQPAECVHMIRELNPVVAVRGNYDHYFTRYPWKPDWQAKDAKDEMQARAFEYDDKLLTSEEKRWLGELPTSATFEAEGLRMELYHAAPDSLGKVTWPWAAREQLYAQRVNPETSLVAFGHVHHAFVRQSPGLLTLNCGSIGIPFDGDNRASYAIVDVQGGNTFVQIRRLVYDVDKAVRIAKERAMPDWEMFEEGVRYARYPYPERTSPPVTVTG